MLLFVPLLCNMFI